MARVELSCREVRAGAFPDLCLRCGAPASEHVEKTFRWLPWWRPLVAVPLGVILVPFGAIPVIGRPLYRSVVSGLATPREMVMQAPLCAAHRDHWRWRQVVSWGGIIALGVMVAAAEVLFFSPRSPWLGARWFPGHAAFYAWIGGAFLVWLAGVAVISVTGIQAARITDREIILQGVAAAFADGLRRDREARPRKDRPTAANSAPTSPDAPARYQVIATLADGAATAQAVAAFEDLKTARNYAQFLRDGGSYRRVDVEEARPPEQPRE